MLYRTEESPIPPEAYPVHVIGPYAYWIKKSEVLSMWDPIYYNQWVATPTGTYRFISRGWTLTREQFLTAIRFNFPQHNEIGYRRNEALGECLDRLAEELNHLIEYFNIPEEKLSDWEYLRMIYLLSRE